MTEDNNKALFSQKGLAYLSVKVTRVDSNIFMGKKENLYRPPGARGIYGGQVIGQCLSAASATLDVDKPLHSMHCYFILAGNPTMDVIYLVKRVRDGKSFSTRIVNALQNGKVIFTLTAQYHAFENPPVQIRHDEPMPSVFGPDQLLTLQEYLHLISKEPYRSRLSEGLRNYLSRSQNRPVVIENKIVHRAFLKEATESERLSLSASNFMFNLGRAEDRCRLIWMRVRLDKDDSKSPQSSVVEDANFHRTMLAFMSDWNMVPAAFEHVGRLSSTGQKVDSMNRPISVEMMVSLDHAMWFHSSGEAQIRSDDWLLFVMKCHVAKNNRALTTAKVYTEAGELVVTAAQEGLIRLKQDMPSAGLRKADQSSL